MKALKIMMYVVVVYLTVIGPLYLFFPDTAENAFGIVLSDRSTAMLHGFGNLVMAFLIHLTASNLETYRKLVTVFRSSPQVKLCSLPSSGFRACTPSLRSVRP